MSSPWCSSTNTCHQETLLYMIHALAEELKTRSRVLAVIIFNERPQRAEKLPCRAAAPQLGASFDELAFGWDNRVSRRVDRCRGICHRFRTGDESGSFSSLLLAGGYDASALLGAD